MKKYLILALVVLFNHAFIECQILNKILINDKNYNIIEFVSTDKQVFKPQYDLPLVSFELNGQPFTTNDKRYHDKLALEVTPIDTISTGFFIKIIFKNISNDTIKLRNVVPFGRSEQHPYITGLGEHWLSRSHLFLPKKLPINVILPDNAWEMGYSGVPLQGMQAPSVSSIIRRKKWENTTRKRFESIIHPGGTVTYEMVSEFYNGDWQEGLRLMFQKRYLYDLTQFDDTLYRRKDLHWMRDAYVMHLIMAWDNWFYDPAKKRYTLPDFIDKNKSLYGGDDVVGMWPTWPTLGLDQRNQWDLFRDLPGGLKALRQLAEDCRKRGAKFFICYNPWDESTRSESHTKGMADLIKAIGADGVVLDTRGESSKELQAAADSVRAGVIMYSEGMAVPKDMPGIVAGRVHNALYYPPLLNLNKLIKPDFAIFRVAELYLEPIKREFNVAFFNGYGTELNVFKNGKPAEWMAEQYRYWGRTARILRENSSVFHDKNWLPLIKTTNDKIFINQWANADKTLYTILNLNPEGFKDTLFEVQLRGGRHFVDLWQHREISPIKSKENRYFIEIELEAFNKNYLGTNNESTVSCVADFQDILKINLDAQAGKLNVEAVRGTIKIWAGNPAYDKTCLTLKTGKHEIDLIKNFGLFEGKFVVQLFENKEIIDEKIVEIKTGTPRLISQLRKNTPLSYAPQNMVKIPAGSFNFKTSHADDWVNYPDQDTHKLRTFPTFFMDKNLVTNAQFQAFLLKTKYKPADKTNFLKHWSNGKIPKGIENYPVVYVSLEDAQAYAQWVGKRLPTEGEWQYAAQYPDARRYPWGNEMDSLKCNTGNGKIDPIGKYANGANSLGIEDLVGNVWQLTADVYQNASYKYIILKGGSHFKPTASWWYVQGGVQPLTHRQQLLRVSPGFERNATVGFRCVSD